MDKKQNYYVNRHSCFLLSYHLVLVTKYRKPVLPMALKILCTKLFETLWLNEDVSYHSSKRKKTDTRNSASICFRIWARTPQL